VKIEIIRRLPINPVQSELNEMNGITRLMNRLTAMSLPGQGKEYRTGKNDFRPVFHNPA
jgi:hypothetical protein